MHCGMPLTLLMPGYLGEFVRIILFSVMIFVGTMGLVYTAVAMLVPGCLGDFVRSLLISVMIFVGFVGLAYIAAGGYVYYDYWS
jgi:hypothetical protein